MKFDKLTEEQKRLLQDISVTVNELVSTLNCGSATVCRWRKQLGITVPRGSKKGKARPWQYKEEERTCLVCNTKFITKPAHPKQYCSISCGVKNIDRSYMQTEEYKNSLRKDSTPAYKRYANMVHKLSQKTYDLYKEEINPSNYVRGLAGETGVYHLDHIVSVRSGFDNNIPPEEMSRKENLQMLPWKENITKGK